MLVKKAKEEIDAKMLLLTTAEKLFAEHGFEAVTTRMLSNESGVNVAMIAYYFGSKEKLFEAIFEEHIPKTRELLIGFLKLNVTSWEKLSLAIDTYVDKMFTNVAFTKMIYRELSLQQRPEQNNRIVESIMLNWDIMHKIIVEGQKNGNFKKEIDVTMTLASTFGTILQIVNTPNIAAKAMKKKSVEDVFSNATRLRVKKHLKQMIGAHLLIDNW